MVKSGKNIFTRIVLFLLALLPLIPLCWLGPKLLSDFGGNFAGISSATEGWNRLIGGGLGMLKRYVDTDFIETPLTVILAGLGFLGTFLWICFLLKSILVMRLSYSDKEIAAKSNSAWEFYVAGFMGLVLGLFLRLNDLPVEVPEGEFLRVTIFEMLRALVWFLLFGLLERLKLYSSRWYKSFELSLLLLGLGGLFLCSGFNSRWLIIVTFLAGLINPLIILTQSRSLNPVARWLPGPILFAISALYFVLCAFPVIATNAGIREARLASVHFGNQSSAIKAAIDSGDAKFVAKADIFLLENILQPMEKAILKDPGNAALRLELARWSRLHWRYSLAVGENEHASEVSQMVLGNVSQAIERDPRNPAGYKARFQDLLYLLWESKELRQEAVIVAENDIIKISERAPTSEVPLRYLLVKVLIDLKDPSADQKAIELLRLNSLEGQPRGRIAEQDMKATSEQFQSIVERYFQNLRSQVKQ
jgi:hypothetical protein